MPRDCLCRLCKVYIDGVDSFFSCHKNRDILLCVSYLVFFIQKTLTCSHSAHAFPEMTLLCWPWTGKCLLSILAIFNVLTYFTHSVFVDAN